MDRAAPSWTQKLLLLSTLCFSQGLPHGFFTQALPVWMRQSGMALLLIGLSSTNSSTRFACREFGYIFISWR